MELVAIVAGGIYTRQRLLRTSFFKTYINVRMTCEYVNTNATLPLCKATFEAVNASNIAADPFYAILIVTRFPDTAKPGGPMVTTGSPPPGEYRDYTWLDEANSVVSRPSVGVIEKVIPVLTGHSVLNPNEIAQVEAVFECTTNTWRAIHLIATYGGMPTLKLNQGSDGDITGYELRGVAYAVQGRLLPPVEQVVN